MNPRLFAIVLTSVSVLWPLLQARAQAPSEDPNAPRPVETEKPPDPSAGEPSGPLPGSSDKAPIKAPSKTSAYYGVGANYQFLIMPQFFLKAFLQAAKSNNHNFYLHAAGAHFIRRKGGLDIIVRVMFGPKWMTEKDDGNWLGRGHDWDELDYTEFHDLQYLWADVSFVYNWQLAKGFYIGAGGGVGLGVVFGKVYTTHSSYEGGSTDCSSSNYSNCSLCHPSGARCDKNGCERSSIVNNPDREKSKDVPPVLPNLHGVLSFRYDIWRHTSVRLGTGIYLPGFWFMDLSVSWIF